MSAILPEFVSMSAPRSAPAAAPAPIKLKAAATTKGPMPAAKKLKKEPEKKPEKEPEPEPLPQPTEDDDDDDQETEGEEEIIEQGTVPQPPPAPIKKPRKVPAAAAEATTDGADAEAGGIKRAAKPPKILITKAHSNELFMLYLHIKQTEPDARDEDIYNRLGLHEPVEKQIEIRNAKINSIQYTTFLAAKKALAPKKIAAAAAAGAKRGRPKKDNNATPSTMYRVIKINNISRAVLEDKFDGEPSYQVWERKKDDDTNKFKLVKLLGFLARVEGNFAILPKNADPASFDADFDFDLDE